MQALVRSVENWALASRAFRLEGLFLAKGEQLMRTLVKRRHSMCVLT